jgi:tetratricopeptide (TPR) repeat protein
MQTRAMRLEAWLKDMQIEIQKGVKYYDNNQPHKASHVFNRLLNYIDERSRIVAYEKNNCLFDTELRKAIHDEENALFDLYSTVIVMRGISYYARYQRNLDRGLEKPSLYERAISDLKEAGRGSGVNGHAAFYRAMIFLADENYPKALYYYCRATWENPALVQEHEGEFFTLLNKHHSQQIRTWIDELSKDKKSFVLNRANETDHCLGKRLIAPAPPPVPARDELVASYSSVDCNRFFKQSEKQKPVHSRKADHKTRNDKGKDNEEISTHAIVDSGDTSHCYQAGNKL